VSERKRCSGRTCRQPTQTGDLRIPASEKSTAVGCAKPLLDAAVVTDTKGLTSQCRFRHLARLTASCLRFASEETVDGAESSMNGEFPVAARRRPNRSPGPKADAPESTIGEESGG